jgi:hypothetical protein
MAVFGSRQNDGLETMSPQEMPKLLKLLGSMVLGGTSQHPHAM